MPSKTVPAICCEGFFDESIGFEQIADLQFKLVSAHCSGTAEQSIAVPGYSESISPPDIHEMTAAKHCSCILKSD